MTLKTGDRISVKGKKDDDNPRYFLAEWRGYSGIDSPSVYYVQYNSQGYWEAQTAVQASDVTLYVEPEKPFPFKINDQVVWVGRGSAYHWVSGDDIVYTILKTPANSDKDVHVVYWTDQPRLAVIARQSLVDNYQKVN